MDDSNAAAYTAQAWFNTPIGRLRLARTERGLAGVWFEGQKWHPGTLAVPDQPNDPVLAATASQLQTYFAGGLRQFDLPLDAVGTSHQRSVWQALQRIGFGQTVSYAHIAQQLGTPQSARAVGAAIGRNPLSIVVPCHRVLGSTGSLTGYAGGIERKQALLTLEGHSTH